MYLEGLRRQKVPLPCQFQEDGGHFLPETLKNKFPAFTYGCSEEVPNLKFQLLCEEIIFLCSNERRDPPGLEPMAALEGRPVRENVVLRGERLPP